MKPRLRTTSIWHVCDRWHGPGQFGIGHLFVCHPVVQTGSYVFTACPKR